MPSAMNLVPSLLLGFLAINGPNTWAVARSVSCGATPYHLQGSPIVIQEAGTQTITLQASCGLTWDVTTAGDVTNWFVDSNDEPTFTQSDGVAQAVTVDGSTLTIAIDASKIAGFNTNGPSSLTVRPPSGALTSGKTTYTPTNTYVGRYVVPKLSITSTILGTAYTHAKSTLKEMFGVVVTYDEGSDAILSLELPGLDNSKINSDNASVTLVAGDGYYTSEYILNATSLDGDFVDGKTGYRLQQGDLSLNMGGYPLKDIDSGREWSCLGGNGQGQYVFNLEVAGITYNGLPVAAQEFRIHVYIYGYNYGYNTTSDATLKYGNGTTVEPVFAPLSSKVSDAPVPGATPIYTWVGAGNEPNLADAKADDFYITWPTTTDASDLEASDIKITLHSVQGDTFILVSGRDFVISTSSSETQISVILLNWAFEPVYTTLNISINEAGLKGAKPSSNSLTSTYNIASNYVYVVQQGGGGTTIDGTVTAYSFYGFANLTSVGQITVPANYTLSTTVNGTAVYYAEDASGTGVLVTTLAAASTYDGNGVDDENLQLIGNTVYVTTRVNATATKTIDGSPVTFTKAYAGGATLTPAEVESYLTAAPGYVIPPLLDGAELAGPDADEYNNTWIYHEKWAWQPDVGVGFHGIDITPYTGKFEWTTVKGSSQQFTASAWPQFSQAAASSVSWSLLGNITSGTTISSSGLLTVASDETATSVAVVVTSNVDKTYNGKGTVNVALTDA